MSMHAKHLQNAWTFFDQRNVVANFPPFLHLFFPEIS